MTAMSFLGGSAVTMARDIADGYHSVSERTFRAMSTPEIEQLSAEIDRQLRDARATPAPLNDLMALKARNRRIQRLNTVTMMLRAYKQKLRQRGAVPSR